METKMVVRLNEGEVANFFLGWSTIELAAYADKHGVPPQKICVTVKGTATQLSAYGRLDITTGEVIDNINHESLYLLWQLFARGEAVSSEIEMSLEEFKGLVAYSRDLAEALLINSEIDALAEKLRLGFSVSNFIARAEKIRDSAPSLAARISEEYESEKRAQERANEEFKGLALWARDYHEAREIDSTIEQLKWSLEKREISECYYGTYIFYSKSHVRTHDDVECAEKLRSFLPSLADAVCAAYAENAKVSAEVAEKKKSIDETEKREVADRKQRVEAFLRQQDDDLANQFREGLLADADLRNAARDVLFAGCKYDRYEPLSKNDCPDCTDSCYEREVSFFAEDAKNLPTDMYPAYVEFTKSIGELYKCTPRYHQVTCANCEGAIFSRYAVLVSLEWEGMTLSREYDPFSTQQ